MVKIIMHGCNGHMGQVISNIVEKDANAQIVAGIDIADQGKNSYPVFTNIDDCQVEAAKAFRHHPEDQSSHQVNHEEHPVPYSAQF